MKTPLSLSEAPEIAKHLEGTFGKCDECCHIPMPVVGTVLEVTEPIQSCDFHEQGRQWGSQNLVDGCVPPGRYTIVPPTGYNENKLFSSSHFLGLSPLNGGDTLVLFVGRSAGAVHPASVVDWRAAKAVS